MMKTALVELHYLPCIAYFSALSDCDRVIVEKTEHYQKQSYRNRALIRGPHRVETLIVPVRVAAGNPAVTAVAVDYGQKWLNNHWRTIQTAYGKAPFFEYYAPDLEAILFKRPVLLYELNFKILTLCLKWLKMKPSITETATYEREAGADVRDLRGVINPKKEDGCNRFYQSIEYQQVFGSKFVPNLSVIDLIFNRGPGAWEVVKASALK